METKEVRKHRGFQVSDIKTKEDKRSKKTQRKKIKVKKKTED